MHPSFRRLLRQTVATHYCATSSVPTAASHLTSRFSGKKISALIATRIVPLRRP